MSLYQLSRAVSEWKENKYSFRPPASLMEGPSIDIIETEYGPSCWDQGGEADFLPSSPTKERKTLR